MLVGLSVGAASVRKAGIKVHTLLGLRGNIPSFLHVSAGQVHDVNVLDLLVPKAGALYVMDRAYLDFARLYTLHQAGAFFVIRAKRNLDARRVYSGACDRRTGLICDQRVVLSGSRAAAAIRRICAGFGSKIPRPPRPSCS